MPVWYGSGGGGGGWATTTTSSTTDSYLNPFIGAAGGTYTSGTTSTTGSVVWVNTIITGTQSSMGLDEYDRSNRYRAEQYQRAPQQMTNEYYRQLMGMENDANQHYENQMRNAVQQATNPAVHNAAMAAEAQALLERHEKASAARARAKELLLNNLSPEQKETFEKNNWFVVEGSRTKTKYRIRGSSYTGNIDVLDVANNVRYRLCVHCAHDLPLEDHLVSQKIMLELAEDDIVRLANRQAA